MIAIQSEQCTGCGACLDVCAPGALYLVDGKAVVDEVLCTTCQACLTACPNGAIAFVPQAHPVPTRVLQPSHPVRPEVIQVKAQPLSLRARVLPVAQAALPLAGAALAWAGREILPRLAEYLLDMPDRRTGASPTIGVSAASGRELTARSARGTGRQHRHRRRGGRE